MSLCDRADEFFDEELDAATAAQFRAHLPDCAACQKRVYDAMMLDVVGQTVAEAEGIAKPAPAIVPLGFFRRQRRVLMATVGTALAAAAGLLFFLRTHSDAPVQIALAETRPIEPRLSWPGADGYRAHAVSRGAQPHEAVPLKALNRLEERGDWHGLADGEILAGELDEAAKQLAKLPDSPSVLSDRAALALLSGDAERALRLSNEALPLPQAQWNRALALRDLGLLLTAAAQLDQLAARAEPGWSDEASQRARALREQQSARCQKSPSPSAASPPIGEAEARAALAKARSAGLCDQELSALRQLAAAVRAGDPLLSLALKAEADARAPSAHP